MYDNGEVVEQDKLKALEFYGKACEMGYQQACEFYTELKKSME
jgi:TPR repeat protein